MWIMHIHCVLLAEKPIPLMHKHHTAQHITRSSINPLLTNPTTQTIIQISPTNTRVI